MGVCCGTSRAHQSLLFFKWNIKSQKEIPKKNIQFWTRRAKIFTAPISSTEAKAKKNEKGAKREKGNENGKEYQIIITEINTS